MIEMRECELFLGNLSVCEQLSGREKTGKLGCSKNYAKTQKSSCVFKDVRVLLLKQPSDLNTLSLVLSSRGDEKSFQSFLQKISHIDRKEWLIKAR